MPEPAWKKFERLIAEILGGKRFWANSGEKIDVESEHFTAQCKLVKTLSLGELTRLAARAELEGTAKGKVGLVAVKLRRGPGSETPPLFVLTEAAWKALGAKAGR